MRMLMIFFLEIYYVTISIYLQFVTNRGARKYFTVVYVFFHFFFSGKTKEVFNCVV